MQKVKPFDSCQVCGSTDLYFAYNENTFRLNQICDKCHTVHYLTTVLPKETFEVEKRKEKENFIFEMREEISNLNWSIRDPYSATLIENIQNILNRIIDYIEEN